MELFQVDDQGFLFIGPEIDDWSPVAKAKIDAIIDLDGGLDLGVEKLYQPLLYLFFPFDDGKELPAPQDLHSTGEFGASLIKRGRRVLSHCGMGHNRSALVAGVILFHLGFPKTQIVTRIRERRNGALYNPVFRLFLENL